MKVSGWSADAARVWAILVVLTAIKLLLIPTYSSTDFEVHRNWMAITHNLPFKQWYIESTSPWTLDYPPLFAWFEFALSSVARLVDPSMLVISADGFSNAKTVVFQRVSVIVSELTLVVAALWHGQLQGGVAWPAVWLLLGNAGLVIVDNIHFQYNGFLLGILVASLVAMRSGRVLLSGLLFAVLLNFKHLYLVLAPVYFVLILRGWCWRDGARFDWARLGAMASVVLAVFGASFGPVVLTGQLQPLLSRLFPFGRGLLHAYWAPNVWAVYAALDKVLVFCLVKSGFAVDTASASFTGGLVQVEAFAVLPQVGPAATMICVLVAMLPCLLAIWKSPDAARCHRHVAYAALCGFMFGYHVHEKASLTVVVPLALGAVASRHDGREFFLLSTVASFAMHPLLFHRQEYAIKFLLIAGGAIMTFIALNSCTKAAALADQVSERPPAHSSPSSSTREADACMKQAPLLRAWQLPYLVGLVPLEVVCAFVLPRVTDHRLPFLPLMLTSLYCAVGFALVWIDMFLEYMGAVVSRDRKIKVQ